MLLHPRLASCPSGLNLKAPLFCGNLKRRNLFATKDDDMKEIGNVCAKVGKHTRISGRLFPWNEPLEKLDQGSKGS